MSMPDSFEFSASVRLHEGLAAAEELGEGDGEVVVDDLEGLVELEVPRDVVDLLDGGLGVLDRFEQVLALAFHEGVALGGLGVLFERHHVDRAHGFEALLERARLFLFAGEGFAFDAGDASVFAQPRGDYAEVVEAGGLDVLDVGGELRGAGGEPGTLFAKSFSLVAQRAQLLVELSHAGAEFGRFSGEASAVRDGRGAGFAELPHAGSRETMSLLRGVASPRWPARVCCSSCWMPGVLRVEEARGLFEVGGGVAAALFESCQCR